MVFEGFWSMENCTFNREGDNFQMPICSAKRSFLLGGGGGGQIGECHTRGFEFQFKSLGQHGNKTPYFWMLVVFPQGKRVASGPETGWVARTRAPCVPHNRWPGLFVIASGRAFFLFFHVVPHPHQPWKLPTIQLKQWLAQEKTSKTLCKSKCYSGGKAYMLRG